MEISTHGLKSQSAATKLFHLASKSSFIFTRILMEISAALRQLPVMVLKMLSGSLVGAWDTTAIQLVEVWWWLLED